MRIDMGYNPRFVVYLDKASIKVLMKASKSHYDLLCISESHPGGMIYGWMTRVEHSSTPIRADVEFRKLDLMSKILENVGTLDDVEKMIARSISEAIVRAHRFMMNDKRLQEELVVSA